MGCTCACHESEESHEIENCYCMFDPEDKYEKYCEEQGKLILDDKTSMIFFNSIDENTNQISLWDYSYIITSKKLDESVSQ